jgi:Domain of unknown function (DUF4157)
MAQRETTTGPAPASPAATPAPTAGSPTAVSGMLASGQRDPAAYANLLRVNPASRDEVLTQLHQTLGNEFVGRVVAAGSAPKPSMRAIPAAGQGGGIALPGDTRAKMEAAFGADLSAVRIHEDATAGEAGAEAYTRGTDIHFAPGRYDPSSSSGLELLGHELTHVVQQAEGRVAETVQHKGGAMNDDAGLEREADTSGATAARGNRVAAPGALGTPGAVVQRKPAVTPVPSVRKAKVDVLGDGTPGKRGLTIPALEAYVMAQADWFTDPSFTGADREAVWKVVNLFSFGAHVSGALEHLHTGEIAALASRKILMNYVNGFNTGEETVQLTTRAPTLARALQLGQAVEDLGEFVPKAVLRHVIPESGLIFLVDLGKLAELKKYYTVFRPTVEKAEEWEHIQLLLIETLAGYMPLVGWVSELHIFTQVTRLLLLGNIADKSRSKPVLLVLMSALDWNTAFLQAQNLQQAMLDGHNLTLIVQGRTLAAVTAQVTRVAKDYGKGGKLGQVVFAGHGTETSMEMSSDSTQGWWDGPNNSVAYDGQSDINSTTHKDKDPKKNSDPKSNGTEALIDTVLNSMDPATANIVFAGCLINSHAIDPKMELSGNAAAVQKKLQANIKAHPNLAEYVQSRMAATGHHAELTASNSSTIFDSFQLDKNGKAGLSSVADPDVAGPKFAYVKTGIEGEGALRAAIECCGDSTIGIAKTTTEMRKRAKALETSTDWGLICVRLGFELALPTTGDAHVSTMVDVLQRIRTWVDYNSTVNAQTLADSVTKGEAKKVFGDLLAAADPALATGVQQAWMKHDPSHATQMMAALTLSGFTAEDFQKMLARGLVDKHLGTLLPAGAHNRGQMILALAIADQEGAKMPAAVQTFLRAAAGGATTTKFPAPLDADVEAIVPNGGPRILEAIGLSPKTPSDPKGNVDLDQDGENETRVTPDPHRAQVKVDNLVVRASATSSAKELGKLAKGTLLRVSGTMRAGAWSLIDFNGVSGFVATEYLDR